MIEKAKQAILASSPESSVYIGADSKRYKKNGNWFAKYSTVIILHVDSKHGCQLFHETQILPDYGNLRQRLMNEVSFATNAALEIVDIIGDRHLEIHLDINPDKTYKSSVAVKDALGWCMGLGFNAKSKPYAWAASHAADHIVKH